MKNKNVKVLALGLAFVFSFTACSKEDKAKADDNTKRSIEKNSSISTKEDSGEDLNKKVDKLMQEQNAIIEKHNKEWEVPFSKADKGIAGEAGVSYDQYLLDLVEKSKNDLSEKDYNLLKKDVDEIAKIEKKITKLKGGVATDEEIKEMKKDEKNSQKFPSFKTKDFDGNEVTNEIFKDKKISLVNFWFNGCAPCVGEIPKLQKLNDEVEKNGGQVIGINTEAKVGEDEIIKEAKDILKKQKASYKNISLDPDSELGKYTEDIMTYPTSILVDSDGNIVGDPIVGAIDEEETYQKVKDTMDEYLK